MKPKPKATTKTIASILAVSLVCIAVAPNAHAVDELKKKLYEIRYELPTPDGGFEGAVEQGYVALLKEYNDPADRGRICASRLECYCTRGGARKPDVVIEYAKAALEYPLDAETEMKVYRRLGDATLQRGITDRELPLIDVRRASAEEYLKGIRVAVELGLPYGALPEFQGVSGPVVGSDPAKLKEIIDQRNAAFNERKELEKRIEARAALERALLYLYGLKPRNNGELQSLLKQYLKDDAAVEETMKKLATVVDEIDGKPLTGKSVLHPHLREGEKWDYSEKASMLESADPRMTHVAD